MPDPQFFANAGPLRLAEIAKAIDAVLAEGANPDLQIADVAPLDTAGAGDLCFLDNPRYLAAFRSSNASACIVDPSYAEQAPGAMALLLTKSPYRAYALAARALYPDSAVEPGVHPAAQVAASVRFGDRVRIEAGAVIGERVEIGDGVRVGANVVIDEAVEIGADTVIGSNASLSHCKVGARVNLHPGVRIGNRGFGFAVGREGSLDVPQLGRVIIEDDVEIGANSTIDRGSGPDTVIGAGSKIDNLVQIGHNVTIGRGCIVVAQAGIAGSTKLEDHVTLAAQGGIAGHLVIGAGAQVGAQAGVMRDVPPNTGVVGAPARPRREFFRLQAMFNRMLEKKKDAPEQP